MACFLAWFGPWAFTWYFRVIFAPSAPGKVTVTYRISSALDLVISNWDDGTYVDTNEQVTGAPDLPPALPTISLSVSPNPFNPRTTFALDLPTAAAAVRLEIFDLRGRRVATLNDGPLPAGHHELPWQPSGLASGVYLNRLDTGDR